MKMKLLAIGLCMFCAFTLMCASETAVLDCPRAMEYVNHLPHCGVLRDDGRGFVYLKVDDDYIYALFPLVKEPGFTIPDYFRRPDASGAHISVFYAEESKRLPDIQEIDRIFTFVPEEIVKVYTDRDVQYIVLQVKSPELEQLRKKYGLKPLLQGHEFHITIAKKALRRHYRR